MLSPFLNDHADAPGFELTYIDDGAERTQLCHDVSLHVVTHGGLYVIGGELLTGRLIATVERWDKKAWFLALYLSAPWVCPAATCDNNGNMYPLGGEDITLGVVSIAEQFSLISL